MKTTQKLSNLVAVAQAISGDKFRPILRCIHFNGDVVEATNGFMLVRVKGINDMGNVLVPAEAVINSAKTAPKGSDSVIMDIDGTTGSVENENGIQKFAVNGGEFPDTSRVMPDLSGNKVSLDIKQLEVAIKAAKKMGVRWLNFIVNSDPFAPVYFESRGDKNLSGVIMPIRPEETTT